MKAASSEWYSTSARQVLPKSSRSSSQRLFDSDPRHATGYSSSSSNNSSIRRSFSHLSSSKYSRSPPTSFTQPTLSFSTSRSSSTTTEPATSSITAATLGRTYPGTSRILHPNPRTTELVTETETSETDAAFTEEDDEDEDDADDIGSAHVPTDEASSAEEYHEDDDDEQIYRSFKESVRMLRAVESKSRSVSPAVSMLSVITDLEEDEEDLPPEEVTDELQSATEDEDEEGSITTSTSSSLHLSNVPKSPVKVRVKVEKPFLYDDQVKVTVSLDESESEYVDESGEDDASEDTTTTADTVKHLRTDAESDEDDDSTDQDEEDSDSDLLSEEDPTDYKTDLGILASRFKEGRNTSSLSDLPLPQKSKIPLPVQARSQTVHEIRSESNNSGKVGKTMTKQPTSSTSPSETSSRSQSARSSLIGRVSAVHKMYSVGGKLRSLSARKSEVETLSRHPNPVQIQLSVDSPTSSDTQTTSKTSSISTEDSEASSRIHTADSSALAMTKFVSLTPPGKVPLILHHTKSLSAKSTRNRQFSAALRQLSLGNVKKIPETSDGKLPPIFFTPPSTTSSSGRFPKPHPFLRTMTYTVCRTPTVDSETSSSIQGNNNSNSTTVTGSTPSQSSSQSSFQKLHSDMSTTQFSQRSISTSSAQSNSLWTHSTQSSSQQSISDLITSLKSTIKHPDANQVSFADEVMEHSLSTNRTKSTSENNSSGGSSRQSSAQNTASSSDTDSESSEDDEKNGHSTPKLQQVDVVNKQLITYDDLKGEKLEDEGDESKLREFALNSIRKQMRKEHLKRMGISAETEQETEDDEETEEGSSSEEDSEEDESGKEEKPEDSHIPVPGHATMESHDGGEVDMTQSKDSEMSKFTSSGEHPIVNKSEESWSWKDDISKNFYEESPPATRIPSAESGYRAMPPSPASSNDKSSRQVSLESEDLEKEKDRLMEEWKKSGATGPPPTITSTKDSGDITFRPPWASEDRSLDSHELIRGDIDLTQELPMEEKMLAVVWNEFNRDERSVGSTADYEFSNLVDEMVQDINNYKPRLSTGGISQSSQSLQVSNQVTSSSWEQPKFDPSRKYQSLSQLVALLSHNLRLVSSETLEDHMASLISLVSLILKKVRKNKTEDDYISQIACLSAIRVLCDRLQEMHSSHNLKYADLSWLFRILCKYSADSDSKIRPEASFCLARLVKVAGPALVVRPIYFILVMESDGGAGKTTTGAKTKAAAIDTLTYALLTFPKEAFHNLEEIAGWVCLSMLNEERRIRQSALECLAVIAQELGGRDKAIPLFRTLFLKEEMDHFSRSPSPESFKTTKTSKSRGGKTSGSDSVPISVHGTVRLLTGPGFPIAQPIDAISARLDKDVLPVPSTKGLIEYAVNVPTGKDLVMLMTQMLDKADDEFDFSSSTDSLDSATFNNSSKRSSVTSMGFSDIDWTGEGASKDKKNDESELITADVAYILLGKGRVNKQDVLLLDIYKKEIFPELLQMLGKKSKGKSRKWLGKQKKRRRRRRHKNKGILDESRSGKPPIPTLSFDLEDDTKEPEDEISDNENEEKEDVEEDQEDEVFDNENSPVSVVVDPPPADNSTNPPEKPEIPKENPSRGLTMNQS